MFLSLFHHRVALRHLREAALGLSLPVRFQGWWFYPLSLFPMFFSLPLPPVQLQASPLTSEAVCKLPFLSDSVSFINGVLFCESLSHKAVVSFMDYVTPGVVRRGKGEFLFNGHKFSV